MRKQSIEQFRAQSAWEQIEKIPKDKIGDFSTLTNGAASLIQKTGFGQAVTFWLSKRKTDDKNDPKNLLSVFLAEWLIDEGESYKRSEGKTGKDLIQKLMNESSQQYRRSTNEAIAYLNWIKRFAKARDIELNS